MRFIMVIPRISCLMFATIIVMACNHTRKPQQTSNDLGEPKPFVTHWAIKDNKDSLDFILQKEDTMEWSDGRKYYQLSAGEMKRARALLEKYVAEGGGAPVINRERRTKRGRLLAEDVEVVKPLPLRQYYKQYIGYVRNGHLVVEINLFAVVHVEQGERVRAFFQRTYYDVDDGGRYFGRVLLDLTTQKVVFFSLNGEA